MPLSEEEANKAQHAGRSLLQMLWEELDVVTGRLIDYKDILEHDEKLKLQGQATGLAQAIVIFHRPFFDDGIRAVSKEALTRYKAKKAGEEYQTIGIAERRYEMPEANKYVSTGPADPVLAEIQKITAANQRVIKNSPHAVSVMVKLFGVSEAAVRRIRGE